MSDHRDILSESVAVLASTIPACQRGAKLVFCLSSWLANLKHENLYRNSDISIHCTLYY